MSSPFDAVSSFQRTHRRANPEGAIMSGPEFLEWLSEEGYDMASFDEEDWRGMAEQRRAGHRWLVAVGRLPLRTRRQAGSCPGVAALEVACSGAVDQALGPSASHSSEVKSISRRCPPR